MRIQNNIAAMNTNRFFGANNTAMAKTLEKLSSGYRVNRAGDDAAGLGVSEKMRAMIGGLTQSEKNCHDAISLVQTAEGALDEVHNMLQRMNGLAVQSANGSYDNSVDRISLQLEFEQLQDEIDHIAKHTDFNGMNLFNGTGGTYKSDSGSVFTNVVNQGTSANQSKITLDELLSQNTGKLENIIYTETVFNFETTQSQAGSATNTSNAGWADAAATLQTQIVPQAVQAIMSKYTAFNYLTGSSIGIGLELYSNAGSSTLASVGLATQSNSATGEVLALGYRLSVNMAKVDLTTEEGRSALEATIAHEMIHAFMDEAMTAGMTGNTGSGAVASQKFPMWFIEGMAQTASGPGNWTWALGIDGTATTAEISSALSGDPLSSSSGNTTAQYGTGYLACMYLGYLAAGADANMGSSTAAASDIVSGISTIFDKIINGKSLNDTIKEVTNGKYTSISAFESGFATDETALNFIKAMQDNGYLTKLNDSMTDVVSGGLISGNLLNDDPYPNNTVSGLKLFALDKGNDMILNKYPDDVNILSGGTSSTEGVGPLEDMPSTNTQFGDFTVTGGTEGVDFDYDETTGTLTVKTGTALKIEGTGAATDDKIVIASGTSANVTVKNVNINVSGTNNARAFEVAGTASVNLTLEGTNTFQSGSGAAGLQVNEGASLVITENSTGSVDATGKSGGAGIGGAKNKGGGTITINGGTVTATAASNAAGIGGGQNGNGGTVTINGGNVNATGTYRGAGIGSGPDGSGGTVTINGGTVKATGVYRGAGIGCGDDCSGGTVEINGGVVTAKGGTDAAGIGGGNRSDGGSVIISGGTVTASGGANAFAVGDGANGTGSITFSTGTDGNADITASNADGDTEIADLISDTSGIDVWSATINGVQYPLPEQGTGNIDLSTLTGDLEITDDGYKIGDKSYEYSGDYAFTGTTDKDVTVSSGGTVNITFDGVSGDKFTVKDNSTVNLTVASDSTMSDVTVEEGSKLNISGDGKLTVTDKLDNDGTIENSGTIENDGEIENDGNIKNNGSGAIENNGDIINNDGGSIDNSGDITNNSGGLIDNSGSIDNTNGTITNDGEIKNRPGGTIDGDVDGNAPVDVSDTNPPVTPDPDTPDSGDDTTDVNSDELSAEGENIWIMQTGARTKDTFTMNIGKMNTKILGIHKDDVDISTQENANAAIDRIGSAINRLSRQRADIGAYQNRIEHKIDNLNVSRENLSAAESKIRDTDMAAYLMEFTKDQILQNASQAMLAQANALPQGVMSLLQ